VLEKWFIQPLGLIADAPTLKEHGVDMYVAFFCDGVNDDDCALDVWINCELSLVDLFRFCTMEADPSIVTSLEEKGLLHVVYLVHSRMESIHAAREHAAACQRGKTEFRFFVIQIPREMKVSRSLCAGL